MQSGRSETAGSGAAPGSCVAGKAVRVHAADPYEAKRRSLAGQYKNGITWMALKAYETIVATHKRLHLCVTKSLLPRN